ncbi:MAG: PQQ-binding-like beta-propeller repeat protein [Armatimonadota bacterium]
MLLRRAIIAACLLILISGAGLCDDAVMGRYNPQQSSYTPEVFEAPFMLAWQYTATKYSKNKANPLVVGNSCYFATGDRIYCVDLVSGNLKWRYPQEQSLSSTVKATPTVFGGYIYFGTGDGKLYCLDAENGTFEWFFETRASLRCPPVIDEETLYLGSDDNSIYAIDAVTGDMTWPKAFSSRDDFSNGIAVGSGMVVGSSMDGNIYGINESSGKPRWIFRLPSAPVKTSPIMTESITIMALGNTMYGLNTRSGQMKWMVQLPSDATATPATDGVDVFVPCLDKNLYCYTLTGRTPVLKWTQPAEIGGVCSASPTVADKLVFVTASKGIIAAYSTVDGSLKWRYIAAPSGINSPGATFTDISSSPVVANGSLLVLTDDGVLHCFTKNAPDSAAPDFFYLTPANGSRLSGAPPIKISAALWDAGSGVDFGSATLMLDGESKELTTDFATSTVSYTTELGDPKSPVKPLKDGIHVITLTVKDYAGNMLNKEWYFTADSTLPPPRRVIKEPRKSTQEPEAVDRSRQRFRPGDQTQPTNPGDQSDSGAPPPPPPPPPPGFDHGAPGAPGAPPAPGAMPDRSDRYRGRPSHPGGGYQPPAPGQ